MFQEHVARPTTVTTTLMLIVFEAHLRAIDVPRSQASNRKGGTAPASCKERRLKKEGL